MKVTTEYSEEEKLKAAYALNMCTVSVSQIVDYNDSYILEQEYDAILNNLNLKQMPKDEALLKILVELLNTITFFRIQDKRKEMIEKEYQHNIKNAIWSAVPNLGLIVAGGNPLTMAVSLASQVGIGYMNYRKEKASAARDKDRKYDELQITALEQFNALKRELFTTAWRLADEYDFCDDYRLTERQIKQYNTILMDDDLYRKKERLEAIQDRFKAYPPFWYNLGHTISNLAASERIPELANEYRNRAKECFEAYSALTDKIALLREDQISAACSLELADILFLENPVDSVRINTLVDKAVRSAGNAFDVIELCMIAYLKLGNTSEAKQLLKILVNEGYNLNTNARLLSRIYVSEYIANRGKTDALLIQREYSAMCERVNSKAACLFLMPQENESDTDLQNRYMVQLKNNVSFAYWNLLWFVREKYGAIFSKVLPEIKNASEYNDLRAKIQRMGFASELVDVLNKMLIAIDTIDWFASCDPSYKERLTYTIEQSFTRNRELINRLAKEIDSISLPTYNEMRGKLSFGEFTNSFFKWLNEYFKEQCGGLNSLEEINAAEDNILLMCRQEGFNVDDIYASSDYDEPPKKQIKYYIPYEVLGQEIEHSNLNQDLFQKMREAVSDVKPELIVHGATDCRIHVYGEDEFENYFKNHLLKGKINSTGIFAILDDCSKKNTDILLGIDGITLVEKNATKVSCSYNNTKYEVSDRGQQRLVLKRITMKVPTYFYFANEAIDFKYLNKLLNELKEMESKASIERMNMLFSKLNLR